LSRPNRPLREASLSQPSSLGLPVPLDPAQRPTDVSRLALSLVDLARSRRPSSGLTFGRFSDHVRRRRLAEGLEMSRADGHPPWFSARSGPDRHHVAGGLIWLALFVAEDTVSRYPTLAVNPQHCLVIDFLSYWPPNAWRGVFGRTASSALQMPHNPSGRLLL
jgi:hypothetical protein